MFTASLKVDFGSLELDTRPVFHSHFVRNPPLTRLHLGGRDLIPFLPMVHFENHMIFSYFLLMLQPKYDQTQILLESNRLLNNIITSKITNNSYNLHKWIKFKVEESKIVNFTNKQTIYRASHFIF